MRGLFPFLVVLIGVIATGGRPRAAEPEKRFGVAPQLKAYSQGMTGDCRLPDSVTLLILAFTGICRWSKTAKDKISPSIGGHETRAAAFPRIAQVSF